MKEKINQFNFFGFRFGLWQEVYSTGEIDWMGRFHLDIVEEIFFRSREVGLWTWYHTSGTIRKETIFII